MSGKRWGASKTRGQNATCRLEPPIDTKTATGGRTRQWPNLPDLHGHLVPLSANEQELWERDVQDASLKVTVMGRQIPEQHQAKVSFQNRIRVLNKRNPLEDEVYDIIGVNTRRRHGRIYMFEIILGKIR